MKKGTRCDFKAQMLTPAMHPGAGTIPYVHAPQAATVMTPTPQALESSTTWRQWGP